MLPWACEVKYRRWCEVLRRILWNNCRRRRWKSAFGKWRRFSRARGRRGRGWSQELHRRRPVRLRQVRGWESGGERRNEEKGDIRRKEYLGIVGNAVDGVFDGEDGVVESLGGWRGVVELKLLQELLYLYILGIDAGDASRTHPLLPRWWGPRV